MNRKNEMIVRGEVGLSMHGRYRLQVLDSNTKEIIEDRGWQNNLILNEGMDAVASNYVASLNNAGVLGTGSRPNFISGSLSLITQSGNLIYLYDTSTITNFTASFSTYPSTVRVGDVIIDSDNSHSNVIAITDWRTVRVDSNQTFDAPGKEFVIWKTSQSRSLEKEIKRSTTHYSGSDGYMYCGTFWFTSSTPPTTIFRRTYDFTAETATKAYSEIGVSWTGTARAGLFSRAVLTNSLNVAPTQSVRMIHELSVTWGGFDPVYVTASITGWPVAPAASTWGTGSVQNFTPTYVNTAGTTTGWGYYGNMVPLEPAASANNILIWASTNSASLISSSLAMEPGGGNAIVRTLIDSQTSGFDFSDRGTVTTYLTGTYTQYKHAELDIYQANSTNIRTIGIGGVAWDGIASYSGNPYDASGQLYVFLFDEPQTKTNLQTLTLQYKWTWARVIQ